MPSCVVDIVYFGVSAAGSCAAGSSAKIFASSATTFASSAAGLAFIISMGAAAAGASAVVSAACKTGINPIEVLRFFKRKGADHAK